MSQQKKLIRQNFRDSTFARDGHKCVFCGRDDGLDAHHITDRNQMPNGGYVKENGITVCDEHHMLCEQYHINNGTEWPEGYHPNDLYRKIGSTYERALRASHKLGG
jgi:5-methylcytosine-specific restriction endonuclease McrA